MNLFAYTALSGSMPGFVSINRNATGDVEVSVRAAPSVKQGVHVCAQARDAGAGRCVAGGSTCNNYCNMAPENGPMQDHPMPCTHVDAGVHASFVVPAAEWARFLPTER